MRFDAGLSRDSQAGYAFRPLLGADVTGEVPRLEAGEAESLRGEWWSHDLAMSFIREPTK